MAQHIDPVKLAAFSLSRGYDSFHLMNDQQQLPSSQSEVSGFDNSAGPEGIAVVTGSDSYSGRWQQEPNSNNSTDSPGRSMMFAGGTGIDTIGTNITSQDLPYKSLTSSRSTQGHHEKRRSAVTEKGFKRSYVSHSCRDWASVGMVELQSLVEQSKPGTTLPFPVRLHHMLEDAEHNGYESIVSWLPHGRAFLVHDKDRFVKQILPKYFKQTQLPSFQRQLNLYGYLRLTKRGPDQNGYYHERCLRGMPELSLTIPRVKVNGHGVRQCASPLDEPDFYSMPAVVQGKPEHRAAAAAAARTVSLASLSSVGKTTKRSTKVLSSSTALQNKKVEDFKTKIALLDTDAFAKTGIGAAAAPRVEVSTAGDIYCMLYPQQHSRRPAVATATKTPPVLMDAAAGLQQCMGMVVGDKPCVGNCDTFHHDSASIKESFLEDSLDLQNFDCASLGDDASQEGAAASAAPPIPDMEGWHDALQFMMGEPPSAVAAWDTV